MFICFLLCLLHHLSVLFTLISPVLSTLQAHGTQSIFLEHIPGWATWLEVTETGEVLTLEHTMGLWTKCEGWVSCEYVKRRKSIPGGEWNTLQAKSKSQEWVQCDFRTVSRKLGRQGGKWKRSFMAGCWFRMVNMNEVWKFLFWKF